MRDKPIQRHGIEETQNRLDESEIHSTDFTKDVNLTRLLNKDELARKTLQALPRMHFIARAAFTFCLLGLQRSAQQLPSLSGLDCSPLISTGARHHAHQTLLGHHRSDAGLPCRRRHDRLDTHAPLETTVGTVAKGSFVDTHGCVALFADGGGDDDTLIDAFDFSGTTGDTPRTFQPGGPRSYFYQITGTATGTHGGLYTLASAPVPEPNAWALAMCAVLLIRRIYRRCIF